MMIELRYYALAALDTYTTSSDITISKKTTDTGLFRLADFNNNMSRTSDIFCELYVYFTCGQATQAVMAIRGSSNLKNGWQDIKTWFDEITGLASHGVYPSNYMHAILTFYRAAQSFLYKYHPALATSIVICGHSLGGALAKLMVAQFDVQKAVVFNAPGVANLVNNPHNTNSIYCVDAKYGIINKLGLHFNNMHMFQVSIPEDSNAAKLLIEQFQANGERAFLGAIHNDMQHGGIWSHSKGILIELKSLTQSARVFQSIPGFEQKLNDCKKQYHPKSSYNLFSVAKASFKLSECLLYQYINEYKDIISTQHSMWNLYNALLASANHDLACRMI